MAGARARSLLLHRLLPGLPDSSAAAAVVASHAFRCTRCLLEQHQGESRTSRMRSGQSKKDSMVTNDVKTAAKAAAAAAAAAAARELLGSTIFSSAACMVCLGITLAICIASSSAARKIRFEVEGFRLWFNISYAFDLKRWRSRSRWQQKQQTKTGKSAAALLDLLRRSCGFPQRFLYTFSSHSSSSSINNDSISSSGIREGSDASCLGFSSSTSVGIRPWSQTRSSRSRNRRVTQLKGKRPVPVVYAHPDRTLIAPAFNSGSCCSDRGSTSPLLLPGLLLAYMVKAPRW
ncbi:hypothetical protein Emag_006566 [Eimeria magna]